MEKHAWLAMAPAGKEKIKERHYSFTGEKKAASVNWCLSKNRKKIPRTVHYLA